MTDLPLTRGSSPIPVPIGDCGEKIRCRREFVSGAGRPSPALDCDVIVPPFAMVWKVPLKRDDCRPEEIGARPAG